MLPHWDSVIHPFLAASDGAPIVEIGAGSGATTAKLAAFSAERGTELHVIDPAPRFDPASLKRRFPHLRFHRERSHDALEKIGPAGTVLIDGDHNWYTVHGELTRLERIAESSGRAFPLVLLHDVEWPYGRRDLYYNPEAIPAEWRQPWERRGIVWGQRRLDQNDGGVNRHLANALEEGGPRNGVLTAVEDFSAESSIRLELRIVRGDAGLGVLVSHDLLSRHPALRTQWDRLHSTEFLLELTRSLSDAAAAATAARIEEEPDSRRPQVPAPASRREGGV